MSRLDRQKGLGYNGCSFEEVAEIVGQWLFAMTGHREMDRDILGPIPAPPKAGNP